jgi:hypothetical protein
MFSFSEVVRQWVYVCIGFVMIDEKVAGVFGMWIFFRWRHEVVHQNWLADLLGRTVF